MKIKSILAIISLLLMVSCKNVEKKENKLKESNMNIIFTDGNGNKISKEELSRSTGSFNYEIYGIEQVSDLAKSLHNQARLLGQSGDYNASVKKLEQAMKEAPNWAYPSYDMAYTYLLQNDSENALKYYQLTDDLAPNGFFTSKTALHTLEREKKGELQKGLYKSYLSLEWVNNPDEKARMINILIEKFPTFAPGWKEYSNLLESDERLNAIEKGLEQNPDIETQGILLINKALITNENGDLENASKLLTNIIFNPSSTLGNVELAKYVLNSISEK